MVSYYVYYIYTYLYLFIVYVRYVYIICSHPEVDRTCIVQGYSHDCAYVTFDFSNIIHIIFYLLQNYMYI